MNNSKFNFSPQNEFTKLLIRNLLYLLKWIPICGVVALLAGLASAVFLLSLEWATKTREENLWLIVFLPLGGLIIGLLYHYLGKGVERGNNYIIDEIHNPQKVIPFRMAPFVLFSTVVTHLFGGSAGREGTAVQMGSAIADQFARVFKLSANDRKTLLTVGLSAGLASIFGTPLAGAVFALEVPRMGKVRYESILPSFMAAFIADKAAHILPITHTNYAVLEVPNLGVEQLLWVVLAGVLFGIAAMLFSKSVHFFSSLFKKKIKSPPLRPVVGGCALALVVLIIFFVDKSYVNRWIGLGVPVILEAFEQQVSFADFAIKILFTTFTLGAGFKGGEVTPLFFVGATLGSALSLFIPLPVALLAAMGFVAVFAGASNTPIACILMGVELFGYNVVGFVAIACVTAYLFSGSKGIYSSQNKDGYKKIF